MAHSSNLRSREAWHDNTNQSTRLHQALWDKARSDRARELAKGLGPVGAAWHAIHKDDIMLMYHAFLMHGHDTLMHQDHADPLVHEAWTRDQTHERVLGVFDNVTHKPTSLLSAIFFSVRHKTQELRASGVLAKEARQLGISEKTMEDMDSATMLLLMVATKHDNVALLKAIYTMNPTFKMVNPAGGVAGTENAAVFAAKQANASECVAWLEKLCAAN